MLSTSANLLDLLVKDVRVLLMIANYLPLNLVDDRCYVKFVLVLSV